MERLVAGRRLGLALLSLAVWIALQDGADFLAQSWTLHFTLDARHRKATSTLAGGPFFSQRQTVILSTIISAASFRRQPSAP